MAFKLAIQSPTEPVFDGDVQSLVAPGIVGSFGVLTDHAPLIAALGAGDLEIVLVDGSSQRFFLTGGFLEVSNNNAMILADELRSVESISMADAEAELDALTHASPSGDDQIEQKIARARAMVRSAKRGSGEVH